MGSEATKEAAKLRKAARLIFIPVGKGAPMDRMKTWASKPTSENVFYAKDFKALKHQLTKAVKSSCGNDKAKESKTKAAAKESKTKAAAEKKTKAAEEKKTKVAEKKTKVEEKQAKVEAEKINKSREKDKKKEKAEKKKEAADKAAKKE